MGLLWFDGLLQAQCFLYTQRQLLRTFSRRTIAKLLGGIWGLVIRGIRLMLAINESSWNIFEHVPLNIKLALCVFHLGLASNSFDSRIWISKTSHWKISMGEGPKHFKQNRTNQIHSDSDGFHFFTLFFFLFSMSIELLQGSLAHPWWFGPEATGSDWEPIQKEADSRIPPFKIFPLRCHLGRNGSHRNLFHQISVETNVIQVGPVLRHGCIKNVLKLIGFLERFAVGILIRASQRNTVRVGNGRVCE